MISSKSPRDVARVALAAGKEAFSGYSHICSPHKFTQPQLFAFLVLKEFEKKDYRGIWQLLNEFTDLRHVIGLKSVPHFTTLQKGSRRLLKAAPVRELIASTVRRINAPTTGGTRPASRAGVRVRSKGKPTVVCLHAVQKRGANMASQSGLSRVFINFGRGAAS